MTWNQVTGNRRPGTLNLQSVTCNISLVSRYHTLLHKLLNKEIHHFNQDEDDNDPFQHNAVPVLKQVFKQVEVFLYNFQTLADSSEPGLQVESSFQTNVEPVQILIFPGFFW